MQNSSRVLFAHTSLRPLQTPPERPHDPQDVRYVEVHTQVLLQHRLDAQSAPQVVRESKLPRTSAQHLIERLTRIVVQS
jgi:hypothetical protein